MIVLILIETTDVIHYWNVRILEYDMKQKDEANWDVWEFEYRSITKQN